MNQNVTGIYFSPKMSNKISVIDKTAFNGMTNLQYFEFSDCLENIGAYAFQNTKLNQVERLPYSSSLKGLTIGKNAFHSSWIGGKTKSFVLEGCKDGVLNLSSGAFGRMHIIDQIDDVYSVTGALLFQLGTNKYPLSQLACASDALTPSSGWGPTNTKKYTGTIRYYYRAQFESSILPIMAEVESSIQASRCQYTFDPIVR